MAFLGKEYKFEKQENYETFLKATGVPDAQIAAFLDSKPINKVEKIGDIYIHTSTTPNGSREVKFTSGLEFDDMLEGKIPVKTTYTVDGNVITQVVKNDKGVATFKREYNGDELVVTMSASTFDGVAKRFYKA